MHTIKPQYQSYFKGVDPTKYDKYVLWGLKTNRRDTFRHIMRHFYETMLAIGLDVVWVDDAPENAKEITSNTLVFAPNMAAKYLPIVDGAYYCLHNFHTVEKDYHNLIPADHNIRLTVYTDDAKKTGQKWNDYTYYDPKRRELSQAWGTNLLPDQFMEPTFFKHRILFWVGSIWNDENNHGNLEEIAKLRYVLKKHKIIFKQLINVPDWVNVWAVRHSRIAPAIGGGIQVQVNLMPCRFFKNISYGQLGMSNIQKFSEILGDKAVYEGSIDATIQKALNMKPDEYKSLVREQQKIIAADHTYVSKIAKILRAFDEAGRSM